MKMKAFLSFMFISALALAANAQTTVSLEGALAWQSKNDQRVPGDSGTGFSFADFNKGPFRACRIYLGHTFQGHHEIRAMYAPLEVDLTGQFSQPVRFVNSTFAPGVETAGKYKFNSYRLTYAYHFDPIGGWDLAVGFTGKIRDAEVSLAQGATRETKANVGFVPLLNLQASTALGADFRFRFDFDGLAAPQGRAFDISLFIERQLGSPSYFGFAGYRMVEGGADNKEVYNFAWIHYATLGVRGAF